MRHFFAAVAFLLGAVLVPAGAHDIPGESRIHAFAKPEGERLHVCVELRSDRRELRRDISDNKTSN